MRIVVFAACLLVAVASASAQATRTTRDDQSTSTTNTTGTSDSNTVTRTDPSGSAVQSTTTTQSSSSSSSSTQSRSSGSSTTVTTPITPNVGRVSSDERGERRARWGQNAGELILYSDTNFEGSSIVIERDEFDLDSLRFNDVASSARVVGNGAWEICEHPRLGGRCIQLDRDMSTFLPLQFNDLGSSVRRIDPRDVRYDVPPGGIRLFSFFNYGGDARLIEGDTPDLGALGFNDRASSIQIIGGVWEVCADVNYGGRCMEVSGDAPNLLQTRWSLTISSVRRLR